MTGLTLAACGGDDVAETPAADTSARAGQTQVGSSADSVIPMTEAVILDSIPVRTPEGMPARYGRKSGRIVMRYSGKMAGTREVIFDNWGLKEQRLDSSQPNGAPGPAQYLLLLSTPDKFTMIDMAQKTGRVMNNESDDRYMRSDSSTKYSLGEILFRTSGGVRLPDDVVKGYPTKVQELNQGEMVTRVWVWNGIILREQFRMPMMDFVVEVESAEFDIDVPASTFDAPAGIKLEKTQSQTEMERRRPNPMVVPLAPPTGGRGVSPGPVVPPMPGMGGH